MELSYSIILLLESRDEWTLMLKKFYLPLLYSPNPGEKIFFYMRIFQPIRFREKIELNFSIILSLESRDESTVMVKKFYWPFLYSPNRWEKNFFFIKIFQPIRFREKIKFNYSIISSLESRDESTVMLKKFHWPLLYSVNRGENFFFSSKFFSQSDFEKKWNSVIRLFCYWNREMSEHWCWKNSICLCCILQIREKKFFLYENFSTNQISRKNQIQLFDYFVIGIERWVNTVAEKILLTFVVFSKSGRKKFFLYENFSTNEISRKNQIQLFDYFVIGIKRWVNTVAEKILLTFVVFSKLGRKNFFFVWEFFNEWDFEKKSNSIIRLFCHWNREMGEHGCWKNFIDLCCILQIEEKKFFLYENFSTNQISRKNRTQLFDYFVIGIERWVNSNAEKILLTFVVFSKSERKHCFFMKIF